MVDTWKQHCPYDDEEDPASRQAWREGWVYRKRHGPTAPAEDIERQMAGRLLYSSWLQGYDAADSHVRKARPEAHR